MRLVTAAARYKPMLEHIARRDGRERAVVRVRVPRRVPPPVLTPAQIEAVCRGVRIVGCGLRE